VIHVSYQYLNFELRFAMKAANAQASTEIEGEARAVFGRQAQSLDFAGGQFLSV
jgi:hypothetical protein